MFMDECLHEVDGAYRTKLATGPCHIIRDKGQTVSK